MNSFIEIDTYWYKKKYMALSQVRICKPPLLKVVIFTWKMCSAASNEFFLFFLVIADCIYNLWSYDTPIFPLTVKKKKFKISQIYRKDEQIKILNYNNFIALKILFLCKKKILSELKKKNLSCVSDNFQDKLFFKTKIYQFFAEIYQ